MFLLPHRKPYSRGHCILRSQYFLANMLLEQLTVCNVVLAADSSPPGLKQGLAQQHAFEGAAGEGIRQALGFAECRGWSRELRKEVGMLEAEGIMPKGGMCSLERQ